MKIYRNLSICLFLIISLAPLQAQKKRSDSNTGPVVSTDQFSNLKFRNIGPFRGGRVAAVTGIPGNGKTFYMGSTGGGVWKTTDAGKNWKT
ncbi:MAG: hypothetical protein R2727_06915 [Bacteroidales bacterium]